MSLANQNYFDIFSLPLSFQIVIDDLDREYKELQAQYHPDRFSGSDDAQRLQALQATSLLNDAYDTLKSPLKRAAYLLKLADVDPEEYNQAHLQEVFLIRQLELREELEALIKKEDMDGLEAMKKSALQERNRTLDNFESQYTGGELEQAKATYNSLQFLFKLVTEIDAAEEKLLDY